MIKVLCLTLVLIVSICSPCLANETRNPQAELIVAKAAHLYAMGRYKEALMELEIALVKDPQNPMAREYLSKVFSKIYEKEKPRDVIKQERLGRIHSDVAGGKIQIGVDDPYIWTAAYQPYRRFINTFSSGYRRHDAEISADTSFDNRGFFMEEHIRYDDTKTNPGYQSTFLGDVRYHDNSHEDGRMRRGTYALSNQDMRFIVGDTSTKFSKYVMRGIYYRGLSVSLDSGKNLVRLATGAVPAYLTNEEEWINPRRIYGARVLHKMSDRYQVGVSAMHLIDSRRVRNIASTHNPKNNYIVSIDEAIEVIPDMWRIKHESAYSYCNEDRTDEDVLLRNRTLRDHAYYMKSQIRFPGFNLVNEYEYLGPDFRSYADISGTNTWLADIASDREHTYNFLEYYPLDSIYVNLFFSRTTSNHDNDVECETNKRMAYGHQLRVVPSPKARWPQLSIRSRFEDATSTPGSEFTSDDTSDRDLIFELSKRLYGIDLNTSYTNRKRLDNINTYATYSDIYSVSAAKRLTERVLLNTAYSYTHSDDEPDSGTSTSIIDEYLNVNTSMRLWDTSNLTVGYGYEKDKDFTDSTAEAETNSLLTSFGWPISKIYKSGRKLTLYPFLSYQLATSDNDNKDRSVLTASLDSSYCPTDEQKFSVEASYRQDADDDQNGLSETEEYRFLLTYKSIIE